VASLESTPLLAAVPAGGVLGGVAAFEPDGRAASPLDDGSGVSPAKAVPLAISMAAITKLWVLNISVS
jgi:hypothetical protein